MRALSLLAIVRTEDSLVLVQHLRVGCQREHLLQTTPINPVIRRVTLEIRISRRRRRDGARFAHRKIALFLYYRGRRNPEASPSDVTQTNYTRRGRPLPRFSLCPHVYRPLCNWRYARAARDGVIPRRRNKTGSVCLIYDAIFRIAWLNARSMIAGHVLENAGRSARIQRNVPQLASRLIFK